MPVDFGTVTLNVSPETDNIDVVITSVEDGLTINLVAEVDNLTLDLNSQLNLGSSTSPFYIFSQYSDSLNWNINHNLGFKPIVQVFNPGSQLVIANVIHISNNQVQVFFEIPTSGFARLI